MVSNMDTEKLLRMASGDLGSDFEDDDLMPEPDSTTCQDSSSNIGDWFNSNDDYGFLPNNFAQDVQKNNHQTCGKEDSPVNSVRIVSHVHEGAKPTDMTPIEALPPKYRKFFGDYQYFNIVQSIVFKDVFESNNSIALCSPTGSGKTVIMELAIIKLLIDHERKNFLQKFPYKVIYMSPLKSICNQKYTEWKNKFEYFNISVCEITGDTEREDHNLVYRSNIIVTTPEKWDSMTRKYNDSLMSSLKLVLVDEIHQLSDEQRGAGLEAVLTRIKTERKKEVRFIAVSASAPNIEDVATWLGQPDLPGKYFKLSEEYRPVKLSTIVKGYQSNDGQNDFVFDRNLEYKVPALINEHSDGKPTLIFCMTRKGCSDSAKRLQMDSTVLLGDQQKIDLQRVAAKLRDRDLQSLVQSGIAFHHSGLDYQDRQLVEAAFIDGLIYALFSTSTLAMGVNLPAHLVIVKGTRRVAAGSTIEYTETDIQQMIGRAGRPQFEDEIGIAIIMTRERDRIRYEKLARGEKNLESFLHRNLPEHINAEIVLGTITSVPKALDWIRSTFYYIRCRKNKCKFYELENGLTNDQIDGRLQDNCIKELNGLKKFHMLDMDKDGHDVRATEVGRIMAHFSVSFDTMKSFVMMKPKMPMKEVLDLISSCKELKQETELRNDDKKFLFSFHSKARNQPNRPQVRFFGSEKIKTKEQKISTLLQIAFGCIDDPMMKGSKQAELSRILKTGTRVARCLGELAATRSFYSEKGLITTRNCIIMSKCFKSQLWENSPHVSKQFPQIGIKTATTLARHRLSSFEAIENESPMTIENLINKRNLALKIIDLCRCLPKYCLSAVQIQEGPETAVIEIMMSLKNSELVKKNPTAGKSHGFYLIVADQRDQVLLCQKIRDSELTCGDPFVRNVEVKKVPDSASATNRIVVLLMSESWIGVDLPWIEFAVKFPYFKRSVNDTLEPIFSRTLTAPTTVNSNPGKTETAKCDTEFEEEEEVSKYQVDENPFNVQCKHNCKDKKSCAHSCCKNGSKSARKRKLTCKSSQVTNVAAAKRQLHLVNDESGTLLISRPSGSAARRGIHSSANSQNAEKGPNCPSAQETTQDDLHHFWDAQAAQVSGPASSSSLGSLQMVAPLLSPAPSSTNSWRQNTHCSLTKQQPAGGELFQRSAPNVPPARDLETQRKSYFPKSDTAASRSAVNRPFRSPLRQVVNVSAATAYATSLFNPFDDNSKAATKQEATPPKSTFGTSSGRQESRPPASSSSFATPPVTPAARVGERKFVPSTSSCNPFTQQMEKWVKLESENVNKNIDYEEELRKWKSETLI